LHNLYQDDANHRFFDRYQKDELTILISGWYKHGVGIALYGNYLIYTNRGEGGDQRFGAKIFKIKDRALVTPALFQYLALEFLPDCNALHGTLSKIIDFKNPIAKFRCKGQRHPTCSFANLKSMIEPLIVLVRAGPNASESELLLQHHIEYKRKTYKNFAEFIRNTEIDEIIKNMFYAKNIILIEFYAQLAKKIITEHHGKNRGYIKDKLEIQRACDFYARIPEHVRSLLNKDQDFNALMRQIKTKNRTSNAVPSFNNSRTYVIKRQSVKHTVKTEGGYIVSIDDKPTPRMHFTYHDAKKMIAKCA
ncbi:MAG: hypothetical protein AB7V32_07840, partial [Candidatus Berkiella sp.]